MQKYINIALVLFATFAVAHCSGYGPYGGGVGYNNWRVGGGHYGHGGADDSASASSAAASTSSNSNNNNYVKGGYGGIHGGRVGVPVIGLGHGLGHGHGHGHGHGIGGGYGHRPVFAPAVGYAPRLGGGIIGGGLGGLGGLGGYGGIRPHVSITPVISGELFPGRNSYRAYPAAPYYNTVALPVVPSVPVAKVYRPRGGYGGHGVIGGY